MIDEVVPQNASQRNSQSLLQSGLIRPLHADCVTQRRAEPRWRSPHSRIRLSSRLLWLLISRTRSDQSRTSLVDHLLVCARIEDETDRRAAVHAYLKHDVATL